MRSIFLHISFEHKFGYLKNTRRKHNNRHGIEKGKDSNPSKLRKKYNFKPGVKIQFVDYGGVLALVPTMKEAIEETAGILCGETSLAQALLSERKSDRKL